MRRTALASGFVLALTFGCNSGAGPNAAARTVAAPSVGKTIPTPPMTPTATTPPAPPKPPVPKTVRPDIFTGAAVAPASLQDGAKRYGWPSVAETTFHVSFDTEPTGQAIDIELSETDDRGDTVLNGLAKRRVTTPFAADFTATIDSYMLLVVSDPAGAKLTLRDLRVKPTKQLDSTSFTVVIHLAADDFRGFGAFNDLATEADATAFCTDLVKRVNALYAQAGIQIDIARSGFDRIPTASVAAAVPGLVENGHTFLETTNAEATEWGRFGLPATNAAFGKSLDIFLTHDGSTLDDAVLGICECYVPMGGVFVGNGGGSFIVAPLFPSDGKPVPLDDLANTVAHELGHFLTLAHPTELDFMGTDDLPDTPVATKDDSVRADGTNIMCGVSGAGQVVFTPDQVNAMRGFLAIRDH